MNFCKINSHSHKFSLWDTIRYKNMDCVLLGCDAVITNVSQGSIDSIFRDTFTLKTGATHIPSELVLSPKSQDARHNTRSSLVQTRSDTWSCIVQLWAADSELCPVPWHVMWPMWHVCWTWLQHPELEQVWGIQRMARHASKPIETVG
jgi:hypothetical protein